MPYNEEFMGPLERHKRRVYMKPKSNKERELYIRSKARTTMETERDPRIADFVNLMRSKDKNGIQEY